MIEQVRERREERTRFDAVRDRLGAVLDAVADGITVQAPDGSVVYANATAVRLIGFESVDELLAAAPGEIVAHFELFDEEGRELPVAALPGRRALQGMSEGPVTVGFRW